MNSVLECLVNDHLAYGKAGHELERRLAVLINAAGAVGFADYKRAVCAVFQLLKSTDENKDEVIISALTPAVYTQVLRECGLKSIVVDVAEDSLYPDISAVREAINDRSCGILLYRHGGYLDKAAADWHGLNLPIIEDSSSSLAGVVDAKEADTDAALPKNHAADFTIVGFHNSALINAGNGAVVAVRQRKELARLKQLTERFNYHFQMSDINAALALTQLENLTKGKSRRLEICRIFQESALRSYNSSMLTACRADSVPTCFILLLKNSAQNSAVEFAKKNNVEMIPLFPDLTPPTIVSDSFRQAYSLSLRAVALPLYPLLGNEEVSAVARLISALP